MGQWSSLTADTAESKFCGAKWELGMGARTEDNPWLSENIW